MRYNDRKPARKEENELPQNVTAGRNSVRELLASGREIDKILVQKGERTGSIIALIGEAKARAIPVVETDKNKLDALSCGVNHQGIVAFSAEKEYSSIDDILEYAASKNEKPFIVIADKIEDPHNLGALIRNAEGAGAHGIIIPKRNGALLTPVVSKASAGALEYMRIAKVTNLVSAVEELKDKGLWIYAAENGGNSIYETDFDTPLAIVMGSEGNGVSHLLLEKCDFRVSIPMYGKVNSFNVASAAAVVLCEAAKCRHKN